MDTIVAIASPPGVGAVSLIRLSGREAHALMRQATGKVLPEVRRASLRRIYDGEGLVLDEGVVTTFEGPRSFTGEDVVEFTGHGGVAVTGAVLGRFVELGARPAGPGEFSERAFLNGRMDLTQAEAIMDLIGAQTRLALRSASEQLQGRLGQRCEEIRAALLGTTAHLEAYIDFPEEDIDPEVGAALTEQLRTQKGEMEMLLATADQGRLIREGVRTVIYGEPNVGKSSLLNRLLGYRRAIVNEQEGTTRDVIEEVISLRGIPLRLIDTAGVREAGDGIEKEGIDLTHDQVERADLILHVRDLTRKGRKELPLPKDVPVLPIFNKVDLVGEAEGPAEGVVLSALTGENFEVLEEEILKILSLDEGSWGQQSVAVNARHQACLQRSVSGLNAALRSLEDGEGPELVAVSLHEALNAIGDISGTVDTEEILGEIFGSFCIGK